GLPREVIELAKEKVGVQQKKVEYLLVDLEREKKSIYESKKEIERKERQVARIQEESKTLQSYLEENKKSILKQAKLEAQEILKGANKLIENTISEIKETQADKGKAKELRKNLRDELLKNQVEKTVKQPPATTIKQEIEVGDWVRVIDSGTIAQV